jgi:hypothetical protein
MSFRTFPAHLGHCPALRRALRRAPRTRGALPFWSPQLPALVMLRARRHLLEGVELTVLKRPRPKFPTTDSQSNVVQEHDRSRCRYRSHRGTARRRAVGGTAGNEVELSKTYPSAAISRKLFRY